MTHTDILIIGGGLSGLTTAYFLKKEGLTAHVLEARNRLGGRIFTIRNDGGHTIEMGATWLGNKHLHLIKLIEDLGLDIEEQLIGEKAYYEPISISPPQLVDLPKNDEPSYRIIGGSDRLISEIANHLEPDQVQLGTPIEEIQATESALLVRTVNGEFRAKAVVNTLPPRLFIDSVRVSPSLPEQLQRISSQTDTWMSESIKVAFTFEKPFWQNSGSSGTLFSNVGPMNELYDHSGPGGYALKGFMNSAYHSVSREEREKLCLNQLRRFYGKKAEQYTGYYERIWKQEYYTHSDTDAQIVPHQNNGNPLFHDLFLDGRLILSGSETASQFPGYMDGAVESAERAVRQLKSILNL